MRRLHSTYHFLKLRFFWGKKRHLHTDILALWESHVVVENSFKEEVCRFKMILKKTIGKLRHAHVVMLHFQGKKIIRKEKFLQETAEHTNTKFWEVWELTVWFKFCKMKMYHFYAMQFYGAMANMFLNQLCYIIIVTFGWNKWFFKFMIYVST